MHSSGMRTTRLLTVSQHALGRGVYPRMHWVRVYPSIQWGCLPRVCVSAWGEGVCPGGVCLPWGCVSALGCLTRGCLPGWCLSRGVGGVSAQGGVCVAGPPGTRGRPAPLVDRQTPVKT